MSLIDFNNIKMVKQPANMTAVLYPHQLASIYNMEKLEINSVIEKNDHIIHTKIGVNADLTGYGKTLSMIGLILRNKMMWDMSIPYVFETISSEARNRIKHYYTKRLDKLDSNLILVSPSIVLQWENEIKKTNLTYAVISSNKSVETVKPEDYDVLIVTPTMYNKLINIYSKYAWKRFIFDEAAHIKVPAMKEIHAGFYWFISATPSRIPQFHSKGNLSFMKDMFYTHISSFDEKYKDIIVRNDPEFVRRSFEMPPTLHIYHEIYDPIYKNFCNNVSPHIKMMIEAGNIEDAITALGGNKTKNLVDLIKQRKYEELEEIESKIRIYTMRSDNKKILEWVDKKNHIMVQIKEIDEKFNNMLNEPCNICFENMTSPVLEKNCQNLFCGECLLKWIEIKPHCPLCRRPINAADLTYIDTQTNTIGEKKEIKKKMTKFEKIVEIINSKPDGKFLIFSNFDNSFLPICDILSENDILYVEIKGNIKTREKNLESFKTGKVPVIFINSTFNCSGINLVESTDIILCHDMEKSVENQIIGRSNRIGRTNSVLVHHFKIV